MAQSNLALAFPAHNHLPSYIEALEEGFLRGAQTERKSHISLAQKDPDAYLKSLNDPNPDPIQTPTGETFDPVPYENLWLVDGDVFIGEFSFRLELNDFLASYGGHVGYGIRPSMMGQGMATAGLKLLRQRAAGKNMDQLLLTCDVEPAGDASERVIVKNEGQLIDVSINPYGLDFSVKRFWVPTAI